MGLMFIISLRMQTPKDIHFKIDLVPNTRLRAKMINKENLKCFAIGAIVFVGKCSLPRTLYIGLIHVIILLLRR